MLTYLRNKTTTVAMLLAIVSVDALGSEVDASIQLGVIQTDNINRAIEPNRTEQLVYRATPRIAWIHQSPGFDADVLYAFDWYRYSELERDSYFHIFDGSVTGKWLDESFAIEVGAARNPTIRDPLLGIEPGELPLEGDLVDRDEIFINPRLNRNIGKTVTVKADYRLTETRYDDEFIQNNEHQIADFSLDNYRKERGLTWALKYEWREIEYDESDSWEYRRATAELGAWVSNKMRIFASGGQESRWDDLIDRSLQDPFWEAGIAYSAGERTSVEIAAGERSFGPSWRADVDYEFKRGRTSFSYKEEPTAVGFYVTDSTQVTSSTDPNDFLTRPTMAFGRSHEKKERKVTKIHGRSA